MNRLSEIFRSVNNGEIITLEKGTYHVKPEDSFVKTSYYCSNSAKKDENSDGIRFSAVFLKEKKNLVIDGNGAEIVIHGKMTPLLFDSCENITVKNLTIDYAVPTMTEFTVLESEGGRIKIRINPDCIYSVFDNTLFWHGEIADDGKPYWESACNIQKRYFKVYNPITEETRDFDRSCLTFSELYDRGEGIVEGTLISSDTKINVGEIFQTRSIVRDQVGSMFLRCKNLTFEGLRVKFMHGLGMVSQFCENVSFYNCDFTPAEGRTIASTADFFQFSGCRGDIVIDSCLARGAQDDYINVHGTHLRIVELSREEGSMTVRFMHPETWGFQAFSKGDRIDFIRWDTLIPYGSCRVTDFERLDDTDIRLTVDNIPEGVTIGKDVVENATFTPNLYVRNCRFGPTSGRGILCTARGEIVIEGNQFRKLWGPALLIEDDCNFWFESGYTTDVTFRNNTVESCNFGNTWEGAPVIQVTPKIMNGSSREFVHKSLAVTGNRFIKPRWGRHTFVLEYTDRVKITDNTFDAPFEILEKVTGSIDTAGNVIE